MEAKILPFPTTSTAEPMTIETMVKRGIALLSDLFEKIGESFKAQYAYNMKTNVPAGILTMEDCGAHALQHAIVHAWNVSKGWDCAAAVDIAVDFLEDVNAHPCARALDESAKAEGLR